MSERRREFRSIVQEALWESLPTGVKVNAPLVDAVARALKKRLMERFDAGVPVYFIGSKELLLKKSRGVR